MPGQSIHKTAFASWRVETSRLRCESQSRKGNDRETFRHGLVGLSCKICSKIVSTPLFSHLSIVCFPHPRHHQQLLDSVSGWIQAEQSSGAGDHKDRCQKILTTIIDVLILPLSGSTVDLSTSSRGDQHLARPSFMDFQRMATDATWRWPGTCGCMYCSSLSFHLSKVDLVCF